MATKKKAASKKAPRKKKPAAKASDIDQEMVNQLTIPEPEDPTQLPATTDPHLLALRQNPEFVRFEIAKRVAHSLANSSIVPEAYRGRANDCFVAIQMGQELGLGPFQAIQSIAVIDGHPTVYGDALIGICRASPLCEWIEETMDGDKSATCKAKRRGDPNVVSTTYTWDDAIKAGIHNKYNWQKYPKRMLQMRARAFTLRDAFPDLLKGLKVYEEVEDYHGSPAPVTSYRLPGGERMLASPVMPGDEGVSNGSEPVSTADAFQNDPSKPDHAGLATVERMIRDAKSMKELLVAGDAAKKLTNENDIKVARHTYTKKRDILMAAEGAHDGTGN